MAARHNAKKKLSAKAPKKTVPAKAPKAAAKPVAKKAATKKTATKKVAAGAASAPKKAAARKAAGTRPASSKAAAKKPLAKAVKGLRGIQGDKASRIAQIVAESFLTPAAATPVASAKAAPTQIAPAPDDTLRTAHRIATELFAKKAEDVVLMDLRNLSTVADYYLIATCRNEPQMRALLGGVQRALSREGVKSLRSEYMPGVRWAVVDFGDIIVHLFEKQTRGFYSLERLWADAPSTTLRAEDYASADAGATTDDTEATRSHDDL